MKYRNVKTVVDNIRFDSKREAMRYLELKQMQKDKKISSLNIQTPFVLSVKGEQICKYVCDFQYMKDGQYIVEDVKGMKTAVYRLKKKLMKACHGIDILET